MLDDHNTNCRHVSTIWRILAVFTLGWVCFLPAHVYGLSESQVTEAILGPLAGIDRESTVDFSQGIVVTQRRWRGVLLEIESVDELDQYLEKGREERIRREWYDALREELTQTEIERISGLVPDIQLPIKFPERVAGIIGQGGELKVGGSQSLTFGGRKTFYPGRVETETTRESLFPELELKQHLIVNLQGTVGQKVHVFVDHDSERESELKNTIRLQYKGEEDEIVQEIEAGDTQLSLPGTRLIGVPPTHRGLFGIKALAKVGPLDLTAIASREQGEAESAHFTGKAEADSFRLYDIDYVRGRFFSIGTTDSIVALNVYIDDGNANNDRETNPRPAKVYLDPEHPDSVLYIGNFDLQSDGLEYDYVFDYQENVIELNRSLAQQEVLAVLYIRMLPSGALDTVGAGGDTLALKMIKPIFPDPKDATWPLERKNVYDLRSSGIMPGSLELRIRRELGGEGADPETKGDITYVRLLGLADEDGTLNLEYIDFERGLITFPMEYPFASPELDEPDSTIYWTTELFDVGKNYYIEVSYRGMRSVYTLGNINIIEGSETVRVNGELMQRGVDYIIDYDIGIITFLTSKVEDPDAEIAIDYQYAPFFALATKSLMGVRAEYKPSKTLQLGSSWMFHSVTGREERPKLGEESHQILVGEVDGSITVEPWIMTRMADLVPLVETEETSRLTVTAEGAVCFPNPNVKGEVYVDDMEATKVTSSLSVLRPAWHYASPPPYDPTATSLAEEFRWYNHYDKIEAGDLYPNLPSDQRNDQLDVLNFWLEPGANESRAWGGVMTCISRSGMDLTESEFLELWIRGGTGTLHIDMGRNIPEDAVRRDKGGELRGLNGMIDTEDTENKDGILDLKEDTGLDGVEADDSDWDTGDEDDGNDDYAYDTRRPGDYSRVNGTEKNGFLDTDDLNYDGNLNIFSDYYAFSLSLEDSEYVAVSRGTSKADGESWRLYRIPLGDSTARVAYGSSGWKYIRYARIWFDGITHRDSVQLAALSIVGSRWKNGGITGPQPDVGGVSLLEERFGISAINNQEDPEYGENLPFDPGKDQYGHPRREQSLVLEYEKLGIHRTGIAYFVSSEADTFINYRSLRFWLHADTTEPICFIRFGGDTANYYEYRIAVQDSGWQEVIVDLDSLPRLKLAQSRGETIDPEGRYQIRGDPSLTKIRRITLGVTNPKPYPITGQVWINEIRLIDVRRERGTKTNLTATAQFADLLSLSSSLTQEDAQFRGIGSRGPSNLTSRSMGTTATLSLNKFLPEKWGFSIPLSTSFSESEAVPRYAPGSDIELSGEDAQRQKSTASSRGADLSVSKGKRSLNRLVRWTIDSMTGKFSWSQRGSDAYTSADTSAQISSRISWSYSPQVSPVPLWPKPLKLSYFPKSLSWSLGYRWDQSRRYSKLDTLTVKTSDYFHRHASGDVGMTYQPFRTLTSQYNLSVVNDLDQQQEVKGVNVGVEISRLQNISASFSPTIMDLLAPTLSYNGSYNEDHRPELRQMVDGDSVDLRNVSNSSRRAVQLTFFLSKLVELATSIRDESKDSVAVPGSPQWFAREMERAAGRIISPRMTYVHERNSRYYRLKERPESSYQWGFEAEIPGISKLESPEDSRSINNSYQVSSGLNLRMFSLGVSYRGSDSETRSYGSANWSWSSTWPSLELSLPYFDRLLPFDDLIDYSELRSGFSVTNNESGKVGEDAQERRNRLSFSPLFSWRTRWLKGINTTLSGTQATERTESFVTDVTTRRKEGAYSLSVGYVFSAPTGMSLPIFGERIRFKSNLDFALDMEYRTNKQWQVDQTGENVWADDVSYSIRPHASYEFSPSITGGMEALYSESKSRKTGRGQRTIELAVNVLIRF